MSDLFEILDYFNKSDMNELEVEMPDLKIKCSKGKNTAPIYNMPPVTPMPPAPPTASDMPDVGNAANGNEAGNDFSNSKVIRAPLVGTFYTSVSPDNPPFIQIGDKVEKGQIIGIIEAMKVMNEIESEFDGEVVQILVNNNDIVEYDQPLYVIK